MALSNEIKNFKWVVQEKTKRVLKITFLAMELFPGFSSVYAQSLIYSEDLLKFDYLTRRFISESVQIPIEQPFKISVDGLSSKDIVVIQANEVKYADIIAK
ncbi:hypothetical protein QFZ20_002170 [Flavobacterium sp. W4I14]|nr:hypothetical protein [Flavobacterium sp. W4I14]